MLVSTAAILHDPADNEPPVSDENKPVFSHNDSETSPGPSTPRDPANGEESYFEPF
jgi:hypothetical protein